MLPKLKVFSRSYFTNHRRSCHHDLRGPRPAKTCKERSVTYDDVPCHSDPCAEACHKEGFTEGECGVVTIIPPYGACFCKKEC